MLIIKEFAENKREIERKLTSKADNIIEHLFKLYCMPNSENRNHWCTEIANFLFKVDKLSYNNKFPDANLIYKWTYYKSEDLISDENYMSVMIKETERKYNISINKSINQVSEEFDIICKEYFKWLSEKLGVYGRVDRYDIFDKLNELF